MRLRALFVTTLFAFSVSACSGGGGAPAIVPAPGSSPVITSGGKTATARMTLVIANGAASSAHERRPQFVASGTEGVQVIVYAHSDTTHSTPVGTSVTNVSNGSNACTGGAGQRTCTVAVTAPAGDDDFVFTLYDRAPASNAIPAGAHLLGTAGVTQTIVANTTNVVDAGIGAVITAIGVTTQAKFAGYKQNIGVTIAPADYGDAVTAGSSNAPFANPIIVKIAESGGSGHAALQLNGGTPATQVTVSKSTDTVQVAYDGLGSAGYQMTLTLTAPAIGGQAGATETALLQPAFIVANPTVFYSPSPALNTYPEGQHVLSISDPGASGTPAFSAKETGCTEILSVGTIVQNGTNASLLVVGGTKPSQSGCTLTISDGHYTYSIAVTNALRALGAPTVTHEYATGASDPTGLTTGADGNLWFSEACSSEPAISSIKPDGTGYTQHPLAAHGWQYPYGVATGGDGNVWVGDDDTNIVGKVTPAGSITGFTAQTDSEANFLAAGLDGLMWFGECSGNIVGGLSTTGSLHEVTVSGGGDIEGAALGPDGNIWFTDCATDKVGTVAGGVAKEFSATTTYEPFVIAAGSDGALWFTEGPVIGRMDTSGTLTEYPLPGSGSAEFIVPGPDGALWFTDSGNNAIGRIATGTHTITEYPVPTSGAALEGITVGPDGNIWFTEAGPAKIGVLSL